MTDRGMRTSMLYAGPLPDAKVVLPFGEFHLIAEIHEEAGAYAEFDINTRFPTYLPDQQEYESIDVAAMLKKYSEIGDQSRVSQILQADVSVNLSNQNTITIKHNFRNLAIFLKYESFKNINAGIDSCGSLLVQYLLFYG